MDFGLAKLLPKDTTERARYTMTGSIGNIRYTAPEVANNSVYDEKVDVYGKSSERWLDLGFYPTSLI